ncbi:PIG-L family deacetylase, partial [Patescibacteria group bacterium]|nr:PIG-L family deacetylase [Patescibacteria group bacterium]
MNEIVKDIIKNKRTCYFISPHLDDAAFSAGGLISYLAKRTKVVVITAFTRAGRDKHSLSALSYVNQCGYKKNEIGRFFSARRKEDKELFESLGVKVMHLGFLDALWRKKKSLNLIEKFSTLFINEFRYIYPTYRLHISKGK